MCMQKDERMFFTIASHLYATRNLYWKRLIMIRERDRERERRKNREKQ